MREALVCIFLILGGKGPDVNGLSQKFLVFCPNVHIYVTILDLFSLYVNDIPSTATPPHLNIQIVFAPYLQILENV